MKLVGISGTNGSGKDSLGEILAKYHGYMFISVADLLRKEAKKRGQEPERLDLRTISAEWRREKGTGVLVDMAIEKFKQSNNQYEGLVVGSLRNAGEVEAIHKAGGRVVWVDADPKVRHERVTGRGRDAESKMSYEQFLDHEQAEMIRSGDEHTLNMADVKKMADITIRNDSNDLSNFRKAIEKALGL